MGEKYLKGKIAANDEEKIKVKELLRIELICRLEGEQRLNTGITD